MSFRTGDRVRILDFRGDTSQPFWAHQMDDLVGTVQTIESVYGKYPSLCGWNWNVRWLELIDNTEPTNDKEKAVASSTELHRAATLSDDDQLLVNEGIMNSDGSLTSTGRDSVAQLIFDKEGSQVKSDILTAIKKLRGTTETPTE